MNRRLKSLGLALLAVLAFASVSVSAASAAEFHSEIAHTALSGTQVGEDVFTTNAGTVKCKKASYTGTSSAVTTPHQTVAPSYSECTAFGFVNATIDPNGCTYTFAAVAGTPSPITGTVQIVCTGEKKYIEVTAFNCDVKVGPQGPLKGITYTNAGAGKTRDVTVDVSLTGLHYEQSGTSFPGCSGGAGTFTNGTYTGQATVKGANTAGEQVGIWVD
jgi:hypothetical protein